MTIHPLIKKYYRWIFLASLLLLSTVVVFFSIIGSFLLPLIWFVIAVLDRLVKVPLISFLNHALQYSGSVYFFSLLFFLIYTPEWMKKLSLYLERYSFFVMFSTGSFMYGRLFVSFLLFAVVFLGFLWAYRFHAKKLQS